MLSIILFISLLGLLAGVAEAETGTCTPVYKNQPVNQEVTAPDFFEARLTMLGFDNPIVIQVNRTWSPVGVDHFYALLRDGYFDCAAFYLIMGTDTSEDELSFAQTGIAADPDMSSKWFNYIEDDSVTVARQSNAQYTLSYVPADGFGTRSTYIMINLHDNRYLDNLGYYPFAQIIDGFDTLSAFTSEDFPSGGAMSADDMEQYLDGGNEWLLENFADVTVPLIQSFASDVTSNGGGGGNSAEAGSWAFGVIVVFLSSAACVYAGVYIYRFIRQQQGYDNMLPLDSEGERSSDGTISLNL